MTTARNQLRAALVEVLDGYPSRTYEQMGIWLEDNHLALREALATPDQAVMAERDIYKAALESIKDEMKFPNQLESGFVHGKPTLKDIQNRVELAESIAHAALERYNTQVSS